MNCIEEYKQNTASKHLRITTMVLGSVNSQREMTELSTVPFLYILIGH